MNAAVSGTVKFFGFQRGNILYFHGIKNDRIMKKLKIFIEIFSVIGYNNSYR